jgi:MinD-like ATPase involved in chromosome partitioning or flagellar assembly
LSQLFEDHAVFRSFQGSAASRFSRARPIKQVAPAAGAELRMFNAVLISPDPLRQAVFQRLAVESGHVELQVHRNAQPNAWHAPHTIAPQTDLIFLDLSDGDDAFLRAGQIRQVAPAVPLIGFGDKVRQTQPGGDGPFTLMTAGVPDRETFEDIVRYAIHSTREPVLRGLFAFLPSKAGSGATTVLLHTAWSLAASSGQRVMVIEADLRSGVLPTYLNTEPRWSVLNAFAAPHRDLPRHLQKAISCHGVEFLLGRGEADGFLPSWYHYHWLVSAARARSGFVLTDLPELVNPATADIVCRAEKVFLVCTPEIASLRLAGRRRGELARWGVPDERLAVIVNRWTDRQVARRDVETFLRREVFAFVPNDYPAIREAVLNAAPAPANTPLGRAFISLASMIKGGPAAAPPRPAGLLSRLREALA